MIKIYNAVILYKDKFDADNFHLRGSDTDNITAGVKLATRPA
jgi:hypothetical protein